MMSASSIAAERAPALLLDASSAWVNLANHVDTLIDDAKVLSVADVAADAASDFKPMGRTFSLGFTQAAVWLRFTVDTKFDTPSEWWLEVNQPLMEDIRLYAPLPDGGFVERRGGENYPQKQREVDHRNVVFKLQMAEPGAHTYYLRLTTQKAMTAQFKLWRPNPFLSAMTRDTIMHSVFFGMIGAILLFYLLFWVYTKQVASRYYLVYIFLLAIINGIDLGYFQAYMMPWRSGVTTLLLGTMICLAIGVGASLAAHLFRFSEIMPRLNRVYLTVIWSVVSICTLSVLGGYYAVGIPIIQITTIGSIVLLTVVPVYLGLRGQKEAWFYLMAFGIFNMTVLVRFLRNLGIVPGNHWVDTSMQGGTLLHLIIMSAALVWEYRRLAQQKEIAETSAAQAAMALAHERRSSAQQREFMSMVSHEFRTPLAIIDATAHMLSNNLGSEAERPMRYAKIERAAGRLRNFLDDILTRERLDTLGMEVQMRSCNLEEVAENVVNEVAASPGAQIVIEIEHLPKNYECDPELIRILMRNLLENARRHSTADQAVRLVLSGRQEKQIQIQVIDSGEGVAPDELPKLFDRFYRGRATHGKPGAGLGLFLVKRIAQLHGGDVTVESTLGKGSTFSAHLPAKHTGDMKLGSA